MASTKFSFIRYKLLDKCFRSPRKYQIQDLIDVCIKELNIEAISRRTIYYDIEFMMSSDGWDAPIEIVKEGNRSYYRYSDPNFSINNMPLSEAQFKQIQSALDILGHYEGLPQFESLENSINDMKLKVMDVRSKPCISFEHNEYLKGKEHMTDLFNAIQYETALLITYKSFDKDEECFIFHPNHLKQYNNRWYVLGITDIMPDQVWNLALDRIVKTEQQTHVEYKKLDIDWNEYFSDVMGVTNIAESPVEDVHFIVHGRSGHYFTTKPIHESQVAKWIDNENLDVKLKVKINYELKRFLLSYAHDITILSPQSLIEEHKERLRVALGRYE